MSFAETNEGQEAEVALRAGYQYSYALTLASATAGAFPYTLSGQDQRLIEFNMTGGVGSFLLPAIPDDFMDFEFQEIGGSATALTINGNGKLIEGSATLVMNAPGQVRKLRYSPTAGQWKIVGGYL